MADRNRHMKYTEILCREKEERYSAKLLTDKAGYSG